MQEIKNILCPVDFSEFSSRAVRYAAAFAQQFHAKLYIYHYIPTTMALSGYAEGIPVAWDDWESAVREEMGKYIDTCRLYAIEVHSSIENGDPATRILKNASEKDADLIVMGTHGFNGYQAVLMGSVTNKVLHNTTIPVLTVCEAKKTVLSGDPDEPLLLGKILCAVDPDNMRVEMLGEAMSLARLTKSTIYFFTVGKPADTGRVVRNLREIIVPEKENLCKVEFLQAAGNPVDEILKALQDYEIDLAVMGHHSGITTTFETLGSVTLRVIPRSNCAVLVLRDF